jgi:selenide,water dikinase
MPLRRIMLIGGGRTHLEVLRRVALKPDPGVEFTLLSPNAHSPYSAMVPELVAGHVGIAESHVDLPLLARWAQARFVCDRAVALDLYTRVVRLAEGGVEPFDLVSLDIGPSPEFAVPGSRENAMPIHPADRFLAAWIRLEADVAAGLVRTVAVVGGGAAGVEMLLAMQHRLNLTCGDAAPRFTLVTDAPHILHDHSAAVRRRIGRILVSRDVVLHTLGAVVAVEPGAVVTASRRRIAADCVVWAMPPAAAPWLSVSGLACNPGGLVRVNAYLQSVSDPFVFAAGDCATPDVSAPRQSGPYSVRESVSLAANLRRAAHHEPLAIRRHRQRRPFFITTGPRHAVVSWGPAAFEGERIWQWKHSIDRAHVERYRPPLPKDGDHGAQR